MRESTSRSRVWWLTTGSLCAALVLVAIGVTVVSRGEDESRIGESELLSSFSRAGIQLERKFGNIELGTVAVYARDRDTGEAPAALTVELYPNIEKAADRQRSLEETPPPNYDVTRVRNAVVAVNSDQPALVASVRAAISALG